MADKIKISGGAPMVDLGVRSWTSALSIPQLASWATFDDPAMSIVQNRITAVSSRRGGNLIKMPDSSGPAREVRNGLSVGKFTNGQLNYLYSTTVYNSASFTMAAIVHIDAYTSSTRDLMGAFESGNSLRVWRSAGRYEVRFGGTSILSQKQVFNQSGWHLIIWSQHAGQSALSVQRVGGDPHVVRAANTQTVGAACQAVFGADEIANGTVGATPSASRSWQDCIADTFLWVGLDLLSADHLEKRLALIDYFNQIYGAAE